MPGLNGTNVLPSQVKSIWRVTSYVSLNLYLNLFFTISLKTLIFFCMEKGYCLVSWSGPSLFKEKTILSTSDWVKSVPRGGHTIVCLIYFNSLNTVSDLSFYRNHCLSFRRPAASSQPRASNMTCSLVKWETQRGKRHCDAVIHL